MSAIGELLLKAYLRVLPESGSGRSASAADYNKWEYDTSAAMFRSLPDLDIKGKRILELGCGLGGRAVWLAANGAAEVVGIDINRAEIDEANRHKAEFFPDLTNLQYYPCEPTERLEHIGQFDLVLLLDTLEHVVSPLKMVCIAGQYAKPGGKIYFTTIGWYHQNGSHMGIPFASLLFSDETILNVVRWRVQQPGYKPTIWDSDPPALRWEGIYDLRDRPGEYLNKISVREAKRLVKYAPFRNGKLSLLGFRNKKLRFLSPLRHVPILNEVFHSRIVGVIEK